jgi:hypothetical protein
MAGARAIDPSDDSAVVTACASALALALTAVSAGGAADATFAARYPRLALICAPGRVTLTVIE